MRHQGLIFKIKFSLSRSAIFISLTCLFVFTIVSNLATAEDWKTYRHDSARSGVTADKVATPLSLQWTFRSNHTPEPAWPPPAEELPRMHSDNAYHVTVADGTAYFGSSVDNKVYAIDSKKGELLWTFFTEGPVRFAPSIWKDRVYVGSDDGYVYCLKSKNGELIWKYRPGPSDEKVLGNGRMISLWPVRTSVLVDDDVVYFGAGVFPYEGIYICALDPEKGTVIWKNDTIGDRAHELPFGGISPQSYLIASDDVLYVPSGRAMPAAFNRKTGQFRRFLSSGHSGGTWALLSGDELIAGIDQSGSPKKVAFNDKTAGGKKGDVYAWFPGLDMVVTKDISYTITKDGIRAISRGAYPHLREKVSAIKADQQTLLAMLSDLKTKLAEVDEKMRAEVTTQIDETTKKINALATEEEASLKKLSCKWQYDKKNLYSLILAGDTVFAGGDGIVVAVNVNTGRQTWSGKVDSKVYGFAASDGRLFVSTDRGTIYCFGSKKVASSKIIQSEITEPYPKDELTALYEMAAEQILEETKIEKGYCLMIGAGIGRLAFELAKQTEAGQHGGHPLKIIGIENDPEKVEMARKYLSAAGFYGARVVIEQWDLASLPNYFANLIVSDEMMVTGEIDEENYPAKEMFRVLRPCGGVACFGYPMTAPKILKQFHLAAVSLWLEGTDAPKPEMVQIGETGKWAKITRGKLEGATGWTHGYANPQNTACSEDQLAKAPLGVLWFGDPGSEKMLERHAKSASPVSIDGRLFIEGEEVIMAYDAYNGTFLWEREIAGAVRARADVDAGNLALTEDALYVAANEKCYRLDPKTGETIQTFEIPQTRMPVQDLQIPNHATRNTQSADNGQSEHRWAYVSYSNGTLYGSRATPLKRGYFDLWKLISDSRGWDEIKEDVPAEYQTEYENFIKRYPNPNEATLAAFKRSGALWAMMADFPRWETYQSAKSAVTSRLMTSDMIFAIDPETGKSLWKYQGDQLAHITISIGDGKIFFAESTISEEQKRLAIEQRQELAKKGIYRDLDKANAEYDDLDVRLVVCLDATTGEKIWEKPLDLTGCGGDVVGTAYHKGVLLFFGNMGSHDAYRFKNGSLTWKRITALSAENGEMLWSHANNYRTRPLIVGDELIIEPRICDVRTGKIKMRTHPITGKQVPWEFLRPGHTCAVTSASANALFYRSACKAIYDLEGDTGVTLFGGIRPGCWINMIPASGLLLSPEASAGCTCSYPLRCSVAFTHKPKKTAPWSVYITHGPTTPVKRFGINLGAVGDMKDQEGNLWLAYPNPKNASGSHFPNYGVKFDLKEKLLTGMGYFRHDFKDAEIEETDKEWLFTSGSLGVLNWTVPLIDDLWGEKPDVYIVRLGFDAPSGDREDQRVFDVKLQGDVVLEDFDIVKDAGAPNKAIIKEFDGIDVENNLTIELVPKASNPTIAQVPILNSIEIIKQHVAQISNSASATPDLPKELDAYHKILDAPQSPELELLKALEGMATIGSPKSLGRIAKYCRDTTPILWEYKVPSTELRNAALKAYVAVAENISKNDRQKAAKMLNNAFSMSSGLEMRKQLLPKVGFITHWHLVGPFPRATGADYKTSLDKISVNEPDVDLSKSYQLGTKNLTWKEHIGTDAKINLLPLFDPSENVSAYAYAEFDLAKAQDLQLKIGSDDGFKCWLNGKEIGRYDLSRGWKLDEDAIKIKCQKGVNKLLLKIVQGTSAWGFSARLMDLDDNPIYLTK